MMFLVIFAICMVANAAPPTQEPLIWDALRELRGGKDLTVEEQFNLIANAIPGIDYPINNVVPTSTFACSLFKQPGFYADTTNPSRCQAFHRCDDNGIDHGFLCPNGTLFNQISLVCDSFFNVDCSRSDKFVDYSNSRLGLQNAVLLDTQDDVTDTSPAPVSTTTTSTTTTSSTTATSTSSTVDPDPTAVEAAVRGRKAPQTVKPTKLRQ